MLQIKTIYDTEPEKFDEKVNAALAEGWTLTKRHLASCGWNAELERVIITEDEKCCDNCKHGDKQATVPPCNFCEDASKWEAWEKCD